MRFRRLGSDGPEVSVVGVGAWAIGGPWQFGWGPQDDDESLAALRRAFDAGVNWVDTAAVYGLGHSEEVVGQAVREHGGEVLVFTKCGRPWYGRENNEPTYDLRPETIRFELEQSLKRLGTDHVDLYQFHWPDTETGTPAASTPTGCATCRPATGAGPATSSARPGWRRTSSWPGGWSRWPSATGSRRPRSRSPGSWPSRG
jgi:aryl-alcohol dehydrogenase-like predicted oxidoreductase